MHYHMMSDGNYKRNNMHYHSLSDGNYKRNIVCFIDKADFVYTNGRCSSEMCALLI